LTSNLAISPPTTEPNDQEKSDIERLRNSGIVPAPRPADNWLAGIMIGAAIMRGWAQAMLLGAGAAVRDTMLKGG
jgi:hypothetical protein